MEGFQAHLCTMVAPGPISPNRQLLTNQVLGTPTSSSVNTQSTVRGTVPSSSPARPTEGVADATSLVIGIVIMSANQKMLPGSFPGCRTGTSSIMNQQKLDSNFEFPAWELASILGKIHSLEKFLKDFAKQNPQEFYIV